MVGLLRVLPAAAGGLPGVVSALETARQDTFIALNLPVVPNPAPTVMPHGVLEVAVVGALNVGGAIIFPAFNHVLSAAFEIPDTVAQELAATGDPLRAGAAGLQTAAVRASAAVSVIADSVVTAIDDIGAARASPSPRIRLCRCRTLAGRQLRPESRREPAEPATTTEKPATDPADTSHPPRGLASNLRQSVRSAVSASDDERSDVTQSDSKRNDSKQGDSTLSDSKQSDGDQGSDRPHHERH